LKERDASALQAILPGLQPFAGADALFINYPIIKVQSKKNSDGVLIPSLFLKLITF
jgi:hypothetical protein